MAGVSVMPIWGEMSPELTSADGTVVTVTPVVLMRKESCQSTWPLPASMAYRLSFSVATKTTLCTPGLEPVVIFTPAIYTGWASTWPSTGVVNCLPKLPATTLAGVKTVSLASTPELATE